MQRPEQQRPERYTEEEWRYLIEPWEHAWPDGWREIREDRDRWAPNLHAICVRNGLDFDEGYRYAFGSHAVYLFPTFVVKIHARYSPVWYPREVETLATLGGEPGVHAPRLIGHDDAERGRTGQPYIVLERLPGEPWRTIRDEGTDAGRRAAVPQMARAARAMHRFPTLESFAEEHPEARSLDELLELQWACTRS